jgi:UDP:flavonoid glycosyltransferase YjiC (YdhE family)
MNNKRKILFFGEAVSLAHVARPLVLADALISQGYEVFFACDPVYKKFVDQYQNLKYIPIKSISPEKFMSSLYYGNSIYSKSILEQYVADDVKVINDINPDLIVGDFRISLSLSSKICNKTHFSLTNAHWSPFANNQYQSPETIYTKYLGFEFANVLFKLVYPIAFKEQAKPFNKLANQLSINKANDIRDMYTRGDKVLYLDPTNLFNMNKLPENHHFIGPIIWSPKIEAPFWLKQIQNSNNNVYATFGSSGLAKLLPRVCEGILESGNKAIVATANRVKVPFNPNILQADFLPGETILENCNLAICNGGSATVYQALSKGVPVIGVPQNLDQFLTMQSIEANGLGLLLRPSQATPSKIAQAIKEIKENPIFKINAEKIKIKFQNKDSVKQFTKIVSEFFIKDQVSIFAQLVS